MNEHHSAESQHRSDGKSARPLWRRALVASLVTTSLVIPGAMTFAAYQQVEPQQSPFVLFLPVLTDGRTPQPSPTSPTQNHRK